MMEELEATVLTLNQLETVSGAAGASAQRWQQAVTQAQNIGNLVAEGKLSPDAGRELADSLGAAFRAGRPIGKGPNAWLFR